MSETADAEKVTCENRAELRRMAAEARATWGDPLAGANCSICGATADNFHVSDELWDRVGLGHVQACFKCFRIAAWHTGIRPDPSWQVSPSAAGQEYVLRAEFERRIDAAFKEAERYRQLWLLERSAPKGSRVHEPAAPGVASGEGNDPATGADTNAR